MNRFFTLLLAASCLTAVGQVESVCGCADETGLEDETIFTLTAPQGFEFGSVLFASYGTPVGDCDGLLEFGSCHSENSIEIVESLISENGTTISIYPNNNTFADPCVGIGKRLCVEIGLLQLPALGCTDIESCNYDAEANLDDGSCVSCDLVASFCGEGTVWDEATSTCIVANPSDSNFDGCVQLNDLLDLLSAYGDCAAEESAWQCGDPLEYQGYDYETVEIGEQCWFAENLRSDYQDGDAIPSNLLDDDWENAITGAVSVYGQGESVCNAYSPNGDACDETWSLEQYGKLYNWYAVNDERGLCPQGWEVPNNEAFDLLIDFLGGSQVAGTELKSAVGWQSGGNGTDSSGFSAMPGGHRAPDGSFGSSGGSTYWWSSSAAVSESGGWVYALYQQTGQVGINNNEDRHNGFSVRCIKD